MLTQFSLRRSGDHAQQSSEQREHGDIVPSEVVLVGEQGQEIRQMTSSTPLVGVRLPDSLQPTG
jgi:hypothetical protein